MRFFISGEIDSEIAEAFRTTRKEVELILNGELGNSDYGPAIEKIALFPLIIGPRFEPKKERRLIQHKEKSADYRLPINFDKFLNGTEQARKTLLANNLLEAITDIQRKLGSTFDGERLATDVRHLFPSLG